MAQTQAEMNKKSMEKLGKKNKLFSLDAATLALFDELAEKTGKTQTALLREAMQDLAEKYRR